MIRSKTKIQKKTEKKHQETQNGYDTKHIKYLKIQTSNSNPEKKWQKVIKVLEAKKSQKIN